MTKYHFLSKGCDCVRDCYNYDYAYLKKLGSCYKLIRCNQVRKKGVETIDVKEYLTSFKSGSDKFTIKEYVADFSCENETFGKIRDSPEEIKLANNITRARNKILEYVLCNDFVFFVTLTLDKNKYDRQNLKKFNYDLSVFIRDYNKRKNANIFYLFIPETHKDGSWHFHGFIGGLPYDRLELFDLHGSRNLPPYIVNKLKKNELLFTFPEYEKRFGFCIFEPIKSKKQSALYMTKYLTKDISRNVTDLGCHLYYCSRSLKKAEIIKQGCFLDNDYEFDFTNEYGSQSFFDYLEPEQLESIKNKIGSEPVSIDDYRNGYKLKNGFYSFVDENTGEILTHDKGVIDLIC